MWKKGIASAVTGGFAASETSDYVVYFNCVASINGRFSGA
jgi:hypothetical protein